MRFPEFKGEWHQFKLDDVASRVTKKNKELEFKDVYTISAEFGLVNQEEFFDRKIAGENLSNYTIIEKGDFSYNKSTSNGYPWGAIKRMETNNNGLVSNLYICFKPISEKVKSDFLQEYFESSSWHKEIANISAEGARNHGLLNISTKDFFETRHMFPAIVEQEKIATFLLKIDKRIAMQRKTIEDYKSALNFFENNEVGKTGLTIKISELLDEKNNKSTIEKQYDVLSSTKKGIYKQSEYFNKDHFGASTVGYKIIELNDVVLSPQNLWLGNISFNDKYEKGLVSPSYKVFRIKNGFDKVFIEHLLKSHKALYEYKCCSEQGASVVRRNLDFDAFQEILFKIPAIDEQRRISNRIKTFESKIRLEESRLNSLNQLKKFLLANLFI